jgi:hypothetical protein
MPPLRGGRIYKNSNLRVFQYFTEEGLNYNNSSFCIKNNTCSNAVGISLFVSSSAFCLKTRDSHDFF